MQKPAALQNFRAIPERTLQTGQTVWRYRVLGSAPPTLLALPGGELVNDLGFEFALDIAKNCRVVYPAWPRASSIEELADGLCAILDAEKIPRVTVYGASFGGSVAQVFIRRHPDRVADLILSNTGVPLRYLTKSLRLARWIAQALPWSVTGALLRKPLLKTLDQSGADHAFWTSYLDDLIANRLAKADVLLNFSQQYDYHRRFHFTPHDLKDWHGRVLIAESDTDVIGPKRRQALRETYPQAEVRTYHNAGHAPMFTRYDEYLEMVRRFLLA